MDWVMQKATELGVRHIVPLITERVVVRLDARQAESRLRHWQAIVIAACEQCGRNRVPEVSAPQALEDYLAECPTAASRFLLSPTGVRRVADLALAERPVALLIGPEGGLAEAERQSAERAGFSTLRLGPRVLRTETAALAALAALQAHRGDL
jgi:16S rRNA (uracil1498-N3)-methyltransferase